MHFLLFLINAFKGNAWGQGKCMGSGLAFIHLRFYFPAGKGLAFDSRASAYAKSSTKNFLQTDIDFHASSELYQASPGFP